MRIVSHDLERNHLLAALPGPVWDRWLLHRESVELPLGEVLHESGATLSHVYFPTSAIISLLYVMENGAAAEIAVVGDDGMVGVSVFMGGGSITSRAVVQSAGHAFRLKAQQLMDEFNRNGSVLHLLLRYTQALITQMAQTAVCNRHHSVDQQLRRWLLLSLDRLEGSDLVMTQELIANMLGVRREGVTEAASRLQNDGLIRYARGHIRVLNRGGLERRTCECYAVVRRDTSAYFPTSRRLRRASRSYVSSLSAGDSTPSSAMNAGPLPNDPAPINTAQTRIVGLGASAGGLEALQQFMANVPPRSGLAYVVVQHLDPTHKAMLSELLQRATAMPVREATGSMRVEPDVVYVIPPSTELTVVDGRLHLAEPAQPRGRRLPIDVLFLSLARDQGDRAVGVVLSGMGSDGTIGLQAIKGQGGLTLAQEPASAQFDSMPKSAIDAGACDIVALAAELPHRILAVTAQHPDAAPGAGDDSEQSLNAILGLLRARSKHDLTLYKISTVKRRIERRMGVHGIDTLTGYGRFISENPQELDLLFKELLIGVTSFFRDPPLWQELKDTLLPALLARSTPGTPMRAWVVGCSTGEEAYSLAMAFREVADTQPNPGDWTLQIFASDVNADAIDVARRGQFSATTAVDVGPERLRRFFDAEGAGFLVRQEIRQMILFAQHDVILDPPFTRLDILSCRNLMIYFNAALQQRLLPLFHYALCPGGVLILGGSETVGRSLSLFTPLDSKSRVYLRSSAVAVAANVDFPVNRRLPLRAIAQESNVSHPLNRLVNLQSLANQFLLQQFSPPAVLVNDQGDVVYINGHTGKYLEPAAGKANWNIHVMARPAIRMQLAAALRQALHEKKTIDLRGLRLEENPQSMLDVTVQPLVESPGLEAMVMIVFRDLPVSPRPSVRRRLAAGTLDPVVSEDLVRAREEIRALRQEMHASQEELQSANEELQSTNEELQSANEELTTSKEESQSMNEELQTINTELHMKLDDLAMAQSDMQNLLNSTDIATLFLDNALNVRRFTEHITRIVQLREGDIGRPLTDLASTLIYPQLHADAKDTLRTLAFSEKQIATTDGHWYTVRIMPYRTVANVIQGVVITFVDITAAKELESRLRKP